MLKEGTVYVPVYSNLFAGPKKIPFQLAAIVVVRNTDPEVPLRILAADYYDTHGKKVRSYISKPLEVGPLATAYYHVEEQDRAGGPGASLVLHWEADREVSAPIIESVMIGTGSGQGISFRSPGQHITE